MPPSTTALGALHGHVLGRDRTPGAIKAGHMPSNVHWGLFPAIQARAPKRDRKKLYGARALEHARAWVGEMERTLGVVEAFRRAPTPVVEPREVPFEHIDPDAPTP